MKKIALIFLLTTALASSVFSINGFRDYVGTTGYSFELACKNYRQDMFEEFQSTIDIVDEALILQIEYNCEKILYFAEQLNVEAHNSLRTPYNVVSKWYGTTTYVELLQRREEQLLQIIEGEVIDERFTNFITISKKFSPQNYEKVRLEYLKFRHKQLFQWIDESSYKDVDTAFEGYTGNEFYEVAKNYAEKGMSDDVQRIIELHKAYPVVEEFAPFEIGLRDIYIERIEKETEKQLLLFSEKEIEKVAAVVVTETEKETVQAPSEPVVEPIIENISAPKVTDSEKNNVTPIGNKNNWFIALGLFALILIVVVVMRSRKKSK